MAELCLWKCFVVIFIGLSGKTVTSTTALMTTPNNSTTTSTSTTTTTTSTTTKTTSTTTTTTSTTTKTKTEFSTTTLSDTTNEPPDDGKLKPSHKYISIGAITMTGVIVVLIVVICIHVRRSGQNDSSKANPDSMNTPRNLNNRDEHIDRVEDSDYIELGEADIAYSNANFSQFSTKDDVYDKLNGTHFNFNDPTYHHIGRTNIVGACALADSEYSHIGQCVKSNNKLAVIDSDTYNNVSFNKESGLNENPYMDSYQSTMTNKTRATIDFDSYNHVYFDKENGVNINVHMTDNDTVVR